jgi:hypothetical protein
MLRAQVGSYTNFFADALIAEAERDSRVIAVHAAMAGGTGLYRFEKRFPDRVFDVGIAEQHVQTELYPQRLACVLCTTPACHSLEATAWGNLQQGFSLHERVAAFRT